MESQILWIILLTLTPFLELRASIPYGIFATDLHWSLVFAIATISNIALGPLIYLFLDNMLGVFLKVPFFDRLYQNHIVKRQDKVKPYVDKYGKYGVALFIGMPLPGSGSYSGALGSYLLGLKFRNFIIANAIGAVIAGVIMTVFTLTGEGVIGFVAANWFS